MGLAENPSNKTTFHASDASVRQRLARLGPDTDKLMATIFDSLPGHIAVLDDAGTIVAVNRAWRMFAEANGFVGNGFGVGSNYLAVCDVTPATVRKERRALPRVFGRCWRGVETRFGWNIPATAQRSSAGCSVELNASPILNKFMS